ncbi:MAG: phosphoenolpyruvate synthase [Cyclobacteriaceae bacterium]
MSTYTKSFEDISISNIDEFGGKNASLGELIQKLSPKGINIPQGFALNAIAYWHFLDSNNIRESLKSVVDELDKIDFSNLQTVGAKARGIISKSILPIDLTNEVLKTFDTMRAGGKLQVAVRSSATAEDLPEASFAGMQETYLNIESDTELIEAIIKCYASLFTNRAIKYREDNGFDHMQVALSIGIQRMIRSDLSCSGVCFTIDPETGFEDVVVINGGWGLGENIVQGAITPDEFYVFKPTLSRGLKAIVSKSIGSKEKTMVYTTPAVDVELTVESKTINLNTPEEKQKQAILSDQEVHKLAEWAVIIEKHYGRAMDIEWGKDGIDNQLYILQARPETVHANQNSYTFKEYKLLEKGEILVEGKNVGNAIATGKVRLLDSPKEIDKIEKGDVLVTRITNPDWDPVLKKVSAIVTDRGGRTSHAAIVARETGAVAVVGAGDATQKLRNGQEVTVSCAEGSRGLVLDGILPWESNEVDTSHIQLPKTEVMMILSDPGQAFKLSKLPNNGVGLMRLEFAISNAIRIHPMALVDFKKVKDPEAREAIEELTAGYKSKESYFVDKLSTAVATIAAAFSPKDVIVRMSDFKTNEYANLIGGSEFEPREENPMIGWRGASRYYHPAYKEGFRLECEAMKIVRDEMGLENVKLMIPFCRTPQEGKKVIRSMEEFGLIRGKNGLEIYVMIELPSNVILAEQFAEIFDGFSIGSNDLTQLTLGISRDSAVLSDLFDAQNESVKSLIADVIAIAKQCETKIGLCGQAPSDHPEFARFLVEHGIDSISFNPDALLKGIENINLAESGSVKEMELST